MPSFTTCTGVTSTLTAMGGLQATTYSWSTGSTNNSVQVTPNSTTTYSLYSFVNGSIACGAPAQVTVFIGANLSMTATASPTSVCAGDQVTLSTIANGNLFGWVGPGGILGQTASVTTTPPAGTTNYTALAGNGFFCSNTVIVAVTANPLPTISVLGPTLACLGGTSVTLTYTGSGGITYLWFDSQFFYDVATTFSYVLDPTVTATSETITAAGIDMNGCVNTKDLILVISKTPTIVASATPSGIKCLSQTVTLNAGGGTSYTWSAGNNANSANNVYNTGSSAGVKTITVVGKNADGCTGNAAVTVTVDACTSLSKPDGSGASIFPNPFSSQLTIEDLKGTVEIYNTLGVTVFSKKIADREVIDAADFPKGTYILKAFDENGQSSRTVKLTKN
jgi:hypothetical protein